MWNEPNDHCPRRIPLAGRAKGVPCLYSTKSLILIGPFKTNDHPLYPPLNIIKVSRSRNSSIDFFFRWKNAYKRSPEINKKIYDSFNRLWYVFFLWHWYIINPKRFKLKLFSCFYKNLSYTLVLYYFFKTDYLLHNM